MPGVHVVSGSIWVGNLRDSLDDEDESQEASGNDKIVRINFRVHGEPPLFETRHASVVPGALHGKLPDCARFRKCPFIA